MADKPTNTPKDVATHEELQRLIDDRKNDPELLTPKPPRPSWVEDANHDIRKHMRMRERRIRYLQNRLDGAQKRMERDFDQSQ